MRDFSFPLASLARGCSPMMRGNIHQEAGSAVVVAADCRSRPLPAWLSGDDVTSTWLPKYLRATADHVLRA